MLPEIKEEKYKYIYKCPACKKQVKHTFSYFPDLKKDSVITTQFVCKYRFCSARKTIKYQLTKNKAGKPKLKICAFSYEGIEYTKRFHLLDK